MRRRAGDLVALESSILVAAAGLWRSGVREFYGYQLAKHLSDGSTRKHLTAYGTLYRALARLEAMGLLRSWWEDPQRAAAENRPGRRLYALTDAGSERARHAEGDRRSSVRTPRRRRVVPA